MYPITAKEVLADSIKKIEVTAPDIAKRAKAGQFVIIRVSSKGERIPLTIADKNEKNGTVSLIFQEIGKTTLALGRLNAGDSIMDIVGPLGHPTESVKHGTVVAIGGGVGAAEILPVSRMYRECGNDVIGIIGARTRDLVILEREMTGSCGRLFVATDDGSAGRKGFVTDVLKELIEKGDKIDLVYAIGPVPMMRAIANLTKPFGIKTVVSLNPIMPDAVKILKDKNSLPAVCGRVCPQEDQCEKKCVLLKSGHPVAIGHLERYAADWEKENDVSRQACAAFDVTEPRGAIVGSGPAGLTCAGELVKFGFDVTIFESLHDTGGVLRYGIPEFRLPKKILDYELNCLKKRGVKIFTNTLIGRTKSIDDLFSEGFEAIFLGVGAGLPKFMRVPGENLNNIFSANEFLSRVNLMNAYMFPEYDTPVPEGKRVAVIGGGNTAMDSARTALRLGASEVTLIYRRSKQEMPAPGEEG